MKEREGRIEKSETTFLAFFLPFSVYGPTENSLFKDTWVEGEVRVCGKGREEARVESLKSCGWMEGVWVLELLLVGAGEE